MVDYSKWDSFAADLSDSDEEPTPSVKKLEDGSKVHIGPTGVSLSSADAKDSNIISAPLTSSLSSTDKNVDKDTENGGSTEKFRWSQSREEIMIRCDVPSSIRAADILYDYHEESRNLVFRFKDEILFEGKLKYPIDLPEEGLDWELHDKKKSRIEEIEGIEESKREREIVVNLRKKCVIAGATLWWSCVFQGDPEIDVTAIQGRRSESLGDSWEEAHRMFRERVKNREKIEVNTDVVSE
mmetsp:Transcript_38422/g.39099  ORF Transcript_38422/g.39099 Transcript_38422/m.39099 type:complete len:240 (+) Transcript_38422:245-964(+)|eukprot:CAMPEP_0182435500 /NCGR_PEP_ID=MMETSP1167-20130531/76039_1 /TAXON_ID=2988 /ORGANISM="Mallomonas Sp, Strain CCMP3275" /LENGTH=239 /DNA_ID=CAMNT_0024626605 /DNA_START=128 /DNA_END=847 /DNA_ORIENTATION=-